MRVRWQALLPFAVAFGGFVSSPSFLALVGDKWSHIIMIGAAIVGTLTPALVTDKPKSDS